MAITKDDFEKVWASTSPLTPYAFSDAKYKEGWNFIGSTPPSRQMWDFLQKQNDEKMQYLLNHFDNYLPLSGGTMTGSIQYVDNGKVFTIRKSIAGTVDLCWNWFNNEGAGLELRSTDYSSPGEFTLYARDANNTSSLTGKPGGSLTWNSQPLLPVGIVQAFAGSSIPTGWLLCDGSAVSRTTYAALYAVIGTTYGAGNGSTTFNLPNLVDTFVEGSATAGTVKSAGLPNITGKISTGGEHGFDGIFNGDNRGAFNINTASQIGWQAVTEQKSVDSKSYQALFDASLSSPIYGKSTTVQPPALTMRYIIKY